MSLKFNCPNAKCQQRIEVEDVLAGAEISCPACSATVRVPVSHDIRFNCRTTDCGQHLVVDVSEAGRFVKCPACGKPQQVPGDPPKSTFPQPTSAQPKSQSCSAQATSESSGWLALLPTSFAKRIANMASGVRDGFLLLAGTLLALFGMLKLWSVVGGNTQSVIDPVIGISSGVLLLGIGLAEVGVAAVCLLTQRERLAASLVAWLATNFLVYRIGLWWMGWKRPCGCLSYLTEALRISPQTADVLSLALLAFLLVGSYGLLFWQWRSGRGLVAPEVGGLK